ncbi:cytochrome P450 [Stachybotrys elegans]|uniref:Cytochrome P450 n=1 Tax=Stachybotrys elegans TaxID=80388 RepID=A0A8K0SJG8_9HYPO|nr:cytochrome P450 [Stachybotrys elegans]
MEITHTIWPPLTSLFQISYAILLVYTGSIIFYRLYLSPLANFPGPRFAAAKGWYEFYYDFWLNGQYILRLKKCIRNMRRTEQYDVFCNGIGFDGSHLLIRDHNIHIRRRKPLEPFFSRKGITRLQNMLGEVAFHLESRIQALQGTGSVIRLDHAFSAFSGDIIGRICLDDAKNLFLDDPNFAPDWYNLIHAIVRSTPLLTGFPWIVQLINLIPEKVVLWAYPTGQMFNIFKTKAKEKIRQTLQVGDASHDNISSLFHHVANNFDSYYVLSRPRLQSELEAHIGNLMDGWPKHILSTNDVMHRLPRISPDAFAYKEYIIPAGGMSAYLMHSGEAVYTSPSEFIPERWLVAMHRNFVLLAMAEMSIILAVLFRCNGPRFELFETA